MGDLISRLQGDRVTLWRPDVKKQHRTRAPLDQELVLRERRGRGVGQDAEGAAPAVGEIPAPRALQIRSSWPTERGSPGSGRVVVAVARPAWQDPQHFWLLLALGQESPGIFRTCPPVRRSRCLW